jgi:hypothetical protein
MNPPSFRTLYCAQHQLADHQFERVLLRRSLYLPANLLRLAMVWPFDFYWEETAFIRALGATHAVGQFTDAAQHYRSTLARRRGLRRWLRLRVSVGKALEIVESTFTAGPATGTAHPKRLP